MLNLNMHHGHGEDHRDHGVTMVCGFSYTSSAEPLLELIWYGLQAARGLSKAGTR